MSEIKKIKLSREEIAKLEIGHTEVSAAQKWTLTLFFLIFIGVYPVIQMFYHEPFGEWRAAGDVQKSIKAYETAIEDTSLLRRCLLTPTQQLMTGAFQAGNEKVIVGSDGWLFFSGDYEYLINPGFLRPEVMRKRMLKGVQSDPVKAILDFKEQLAARGIRLILLPVPVKPMIYSDKLGGIAGPLQNPSFAEFKTRVEAAGVTVVDLAPDFSGMRRQGVEPYFKTDTHWTAEGMYLAARRLAAEIGAKGVSSKEFEQEKITGLGDIAAMLKLPDCEAYFPPETAVVSRFNVRPERSSDILLLGDSFFNIFSLGAMNWGTDGGFAEALGALLGRPVDAILRNDAGAYATRQLLAGELRRGRDRLAGKKTVVWEFAIRELVNGDWKMLDMTLGEVPETHFLSVEKPRTVTATVLAATAAPRPGSAPYKDHVIALHLGDIDGSGDQALVYMESMRDNVWTAAAGVRPGDTVTIRLEPWSDYEATYGSWNRSEFSDDALLQEEPCWGVLVDKVTGRN